MQVQIGNNQVGEPFENLLELYVGQVLGTDALLETSDGQTFRANKSGEILLYGEVDGSDFILKSVRRLAFSGELIDKSTDEPFGEFSLVGPVYENYGGEARSGFIENLQLQFHYRELSQIGLDGRNREQGQDFYFPPIVYMSGDLGWRQISEPTEAGVSLAIDLILRDNPTENERLNLQNRAARIRFEKSLEVDFFWAGAALIYSESEHSTQRAILAASAMLALAPCGAPQLPHPSDPHMMLVRELPLRFVDLSEPVQGEDLVGLCGEQITGVCEVWRNKAILQLKVQPDISPSTSDQINLYRFFDDSQWVNFLNEPTLISTNWIDVYLVDAVTISGVEDEGGGATYDASKASAGVFLAKSVMKENKYLLAHELGHVLGLGHPEVVTVLNDGTQLIIGSSNTVMQAMLNSDQNSYVNCQIFASSLLNPLARVCKPEVQDCLRPDF